MGISVGGPFFVDLDKDGPDEAQECVVAGKDPDLYRAPCNFLLDGTELCLVKDRADLLAFYDFPAEHWKHIRTTNPIESIFATIRHRTNKPKGCLSRQTALAMTHQSMLSAKTKWCKLDRQNRLPEII